MLKKACCRDVVVVVVVDISGNIGPLLNNGCSGGGVAGTWAWYGCGIGAAIDYYSSCEYMCKCLLDGSERCFARLKYWFPRLLVI